MQKWEYLLIYSYLDQVIQAGDKEYAKIKQRRTSRYGEIIVEKDSPPPPPLGKFLNDIGQESWKVVSVVVDENSGQYFTRLPIRIIANRPISP
jgi:hypothetical protein